MDGGKWGFSLKLFLLCPWLAGWGNKSYSDELNIKDGLNIKLIGTS